MAKANPAAASSRPSGVYYSRANLDRAVSQAVALERVRVAQVFGEHASFGRERAAANLLRDPRGLSADDIKAELCTLPTDREAGALLVRPTPHSSIRKETV